MVGLGTDGDRKVGQIAATNVSRSVGRDRRLARREQLRHRVASVVRDLILDGEVKPGDSLRLEPIAHEMGISVTPVREALLLLAQDGWLAHEPHRGFAVLPTRRGDVEDIYSIWAEAEGLQAARAAALATPEDLDELRRLDAALNVSMERSSQEALRLNFELHDTISGIAQAPKLEWFVEASTRLLPYEFWSEFYTVPGWRTFNSTDHTRIIDAIAASNAVAAHRYMAEHLRATGVLLVKWLDGMSFWDRDAGASDQH